MSNENLNLNFNDQDLVAEESDHADQIEILEESDQLSADQQEDIFQKRYAEYDDTETFTLSEEAQKLVERYSRSNEGGETIFVPRGNLFATTFFFDGAQFFTLFRKLSEDGDLLTFPPGFHVRQANLEAYIAYRRTILGKPFASNVRALTGSLDAWHKEPIYEDVLPSVSLRYDNDQERLGDCRWTDLEYRATFWSTHIQQELRTCERGLQVVQLEIEKIKEKEDTAAANYSAAVQHVMAGVQGMPLTLADSGRFNYTPMLYALKTVFSIAELAVARKNRLQEREAQLRALGRRLEMWQTWTKKDYLECLIKSIAPQQITYSLNQETDQTLYPMEKYREKVYEKVALKKGEEVCTICFDLLYEGDLCYLQCTHCFHKKCLLKYLEFDTPDRFAGVAFPFIAPVLGNKAPLGCPTCKTQICMKILKGRMHVGERLDKYSSLHGRICSIELQYQLGYFSVQSYCNEQANNACIELIRKVESLDETEQDIIENVRRNKQLFSQGSKGALQEAAVLRESRKREKKAAEKKREQEEKIKKTE